MNIYQCNDGLYFVEAGYRELPFYWSEFASTDEVDVCQYAPEDMFRYTVLQSLSNTKGGGTRPDSAYPTKSGTTLGIVSFVVKLTVLERKKPEFRYAYIDNTHPCVCYGGRWSYQRWFRNAEYEENWTTAVDG